MCDVNKICHIENIGYISFFLFWDLNWFFFFVIFFSFVQFTHDFRVVVKKIRDIWTKWWITCSSALWFFLLADWTGCTSTCALSFRSFPSLFLYLLCSPSKEGSSGITQNLGYMCIQCLLTFNLLFHINTNELNYWCVLSIEYSFWNIYKEHNGEIAGKFNRRLIVFKSFQQLQVV